jgi:hypothetical protein
MFLYSFQLESLMLQLKTTSEIPKNILSTFLDDENDDVLP